MDKDLLKKFAELLSEIITDENKNVDLPYLPAQELLKKIDIKIEQNATSVDNVLQLLKEIASCTTKTSKNRFFNQLFGGKIDLAILADMLASYLNVSMYTYKVGGIHILIENEILKKMCDLAQFPNGEGIFCPGGSISNMGAMIIARNEADKNIKNFGINKRMIAYTSCQSHYSLTKNANLIGIGRENVRLIDVDDFGHMKVSELEKTIKNDLNNGLSPFFINATCGTTVLGAFDYLDKIADVAEKFQLWLHADGAWGGSLLLNKKYLSLFKGLNRANSFTWDPHKMMGIPLIASCLLVREKGLLQKHFSEPADYLFQADYDCVNPGIRSLQCGRRNDALKIWAAWKFLGEDGLSQRIDKQRELTLYLVQKIKQDPLLKIYNEKPECLNVCFEMIGKSTEEICHRLDLEKGIKVSYGKFKGKSLIRAICVNADLTFADIDNFVEQINLL